MNFKVVLFLLVSIFAFQSANASHGWGGDITWRCLPNGQFVFKLKFYRDCNGIGCPSGPLNLSVTNHPTVSSIQLTATTQSDLSPQGCSSCLFTGPGSIEECVYESAPITLAGVPPVSGWVFDWTTCCRSPVLSSIMSAGSQSFVFSSVMYSYNMKNTNPAYDSSPQFISVPQVIYCSSIPVTFSSAAHDADGDSLVYSFAPSPLLTYAPGYSGTSPFPGIAQNANNVPATIDPQTGLINFTSFTSGHFLSYVKVESYRCGQLIAEINRDLNIILVTDSTCNLPTALINNPPDLTAPFADTSGQFNLFSDTVLVGDSVQFTLSLIDTNTVPGTLQNVTLDVHSEVLADSILAPGLNCALPPCANLTVPVPIGPTPFSLSTNVDWITDCSHLMTKDSCMKLSKQMDFEVLFNDDFCPIPGIGARTVSVIVKDLQPAASPVLDSMNILPNGDVELFWNTPSDPNGLFTTFYIYYANDSLGPYSVIDSISNFNQTTYTHVGAMGNTLLGYYQMSSASSILCQTNYEAPSANRISNFFVFTGLDDNLSSIPVHIYPNPATETLNINSTLFIEQKVSIEFRNTLGQIIDTIESNNQLKQSVDIAKYRKGIYVISFIVNDAVLSIQKFTKL